MSMPVSRTGRCDRPLRALRKRSAGEPSSSAWRIRRTSAPRSASKRAQSATQIGVVEDDDTGEWGRAGHVRSLRVSVRRRSRYDSDMAAPSRVPPRPRPRSTTPRRLAGVIRGAERPGETIGAPHPTGGALGNQGPDQGYAIKLAKAFAGDLILAPGSMLPTPSMAPWPLVCAGRRCSVVPRSATTSSWACSPTASSVTRRLR